MRRHHTLALLLLASCYSYRPLDVTAPVGRTTVDVELNGLGERELADQLGPEVNRLHGRVLGADSAGLDLSITRVQNRRGEPTAWNGERLRVPARYVGYVQERRLAVGGTGLLGGMVAAGLVATYFLIGGHGSVAGPLGSQGGGAGH